MQIRNAMQCNTPSVKPLNKHYRMPDIAVPPLHDIIVLVRAQCLQAAVASSNLGVLSIDTTESRSLAVGKLVHGCLGDVEALGSMVDSEDVDGLSVVGDAVACSALVCI